VGDEQPSHYSQGHSNGEDTPGHVDAIADFPNLPSDASEVLPAKEVRRDESERRPAREARHAETNESSAKEVPGAAVAMEEPRAPRRRATSSEPRLERVVIGQPPGAETVTEEATTSNAPVRKGWWQRKLGGE
jgi:ribonuclease E